MGVQRAWSPTTRKVAVVEEMDCLQSAGYITKEAILQKLTSIVLRQKMYVTVHAGCLLTLSLQPRASVVCLLMFA